MTTELNGASLENRSNATTTQTRLLLPVDGKARRRAGLDTDQVQRLKTIEHSIMSALIEIGADPGATAADADALKLNAIAQAHEGGRG